MKRFVNDFQMGHIRMNTTTDIGAIAINVSMINRPETHNRRLEKCHRYPETTICVPCPRKETTERTHQTSLIKPKIQVICECVQ